MFTGVPAGTIFPHFPGTISPDLSAPSSSNAALLRPPLRDPDRISGFTVSPVNPPSVLLPASSSNRRTAIGCVALRARAALLTGSGLLLRLFHVRRRRFGALRRDHPTVSSPP